MLESRTRTRLHAPSRGGMLALIGAVFATSIAGPTTGDVLTVDDDGPADYFRIQDAVDAASDGDEIVVAPGRYIHLEDLVGDFDQQVVDMAGKAIRLYASHGPEVTVIDGRGVQRCISCRSDEGLDTEIIGFTFKNGSTEYGGGGMLNASSSPTLINCIFEDNHARTGGAMLNVYSSPFIFDCTFIGNTAEENGGAIFSFGSVALILNSRFSSNSALLGGAMFLGSTSVLTPTISECTFWENEAVSGGAIHAEATKYLLSASTFTRNEAVSGGAVTNSDSSPSISDCSFISNEALSGGGMFNEVDSLPVITESEFITNAASKSGGAIHNESGAVSSLSTTLFCGNAPDSIVGPWKDEGKNIFLYQCPMTPDINGDGIVDGNDLTILLGMWGACAQVGDTCGADLNHDQVVDGIDLSILLAHWTSE